MIILGLNAFHADAAACLVKDGKLIAAVEEERFRRVKHWAGFPSEAIAYCLTEAGVTLGDVTHVALNQDNNANLLKKAAFLATKRPDFGLVLKRIRNRTARTGVPELLAEAFPDHTFKGTLHPIEHHLAHLSSAFHVSPFREAVTVSVDGFGDFASAAWGVGHESKISVDGRVHFPHSLGLFYLAITQYLGFPHYGDEYKVMGLAPYGHPTRLNDLRELVKLKPDGSFELGLKYFRHHKEDVPYQWEGGTPSYGEVFSPALEELLGGRRGKDETVEQTHMDLARSAQAMYEEAFFHLLNTLQEVHGHKDVCIAGGCGNNSVANGKIRRETAFKRVYVHAAPGDAGGAIGAAFALHHQLGGKTRFHMDHAYWGPSYGEEAIRAALNARADDLQAEDILVEEVASEKDLCARVAKAVSEGKVVGWFQGRLEWGPRALGNRSIVCDPRRADMKKILNEKIKRREGFRPFAPSILEAHVAAWFEEDDDVPFMTQVFQIRAEKRAQIPAVTHVDGSGRLQTVYAKSNPRYAALIDAFHDLTGVPMVLNTSFNENEPVVCRPEEALDCFLRTRMDMLVVGDHVVERSGAAV